MKFARLLNLKNNDQLLLTVDRNEEDDTYDLCQRTDFDNGVSAKLSAGFSEEDQAIDAMNSFTDESAQELRDNLHSMLCG